MVTEKGDKKFLLLFLSFIFYLSFTGIRLNHKRWQNHEKVRKQGRGKGERQGREGLDNARAYTCRVGGESTAVFPSPLMLPPYYR